LLVFAIKRRQLPFFAKLQLLANLRKFFTNAKTVDGDDAIGKHFSVIHYLEQDIE
jgi:hypothetical protein